ncbi:uncharacterized protein VTP21DRAFT_2597 [Calcarisporiella thermophila]|uniref:uncharacterized protein n=1 Tax=Calcarisporiella thermophila TaxID=911321 RepID=UPI0037449AD7
MILLDYHNLIIQETLKSRFSSEKVENIRMTVVDFDGVTYFIHTPESKTRIVLSMAMKCYKELEQYGANDILQREYGPYLITPPEQGYNVTLEFNLENLPEDKDELIKKVSLLKRNVLAAPFERAFEQQRQLEEQKDAPPNTEVMSIHYRDEEAIYIQAQADRVTVIFSTLFKDETDRVFGKVFLQEFIDARRRPAIQNAPQVLFANREPPLEIRHVGGLRDSDEVGYVTFVLFPRHFAQGQVREETISRIQIFRDYLHYHIKCSKAYMHSRMRMRVAEFLKVINRAKPENAQAEKKLASGRAFRRP